MNTVIKRAKADAVEPERDHVAMLEVAGQEPQRDHSRDRGGRGGDHRGATHPVAVGSGEVVHLVEASREDRRGGEEEAVSGGVGVVQAARKTRGHDHAIAADAEARPSVGVSIRRFLTVALNAAISAIQSRQK